MTDLIHVFTGAVFLATLVCLYRVMDLADQVHALSVTVVAKLNSCQSDVFALHRAMRGLRLLDNIEEVTRCIVVLDNPPLSEKSQGELDEAWRAGRFGAGPRPGDLMMHNGAEYMHNGCEWRYAVDGRGRKRR